MRCLGGVGPAVAQCDAIAGAFPPLSPTTAAKDERFYQPARRQALYRFAASVSTFPFGKIDRLLVLASSREVAHNSARSCALRRCGGGIEIEALLRLARDGSHGRRGLGAVFTSRAAQFSQQRGVLLIGAGDLSTLRQFDPRRAEPA